MRRRIIAYIAALSLIAGALLMSKVYSFAVQFKHRIKALEQELADNRIMSAFMFQEYCANRQITEHGSKVMSVLCLGNSITLHPRNDSIEWYSEWGMAASKKEKDYCHRLEAMLKKSNEASSVTPLNIATWEQSLSCSQLDSLIGDNIKEKDAVVIRLGENVQDKSRFTAALDSLVAFCKKNTNKIVITGCFWRDDTKEVSIIEVAKKYGLDYVPLFWIDGLYDVRPFRGGNYLIQKGIAIV